MLNRFFGPALSVRAAWLGLFFGLVSPASSRAQTPLGQPSLDEAKVQIWCAAARYVYDDAGRPQLKRTLHCESGNLRTLAASLRPDSLRIYSLLYAPIEGKGRIYKGLKDNPTRLAALSKAIISKLKSSPSRQHDPARLASLQALEKKLTDYVQTGLPPADPTPAPQATAEASTSAGPAEAAEATAGASGAIVPAPVPLGTASLLDRFFAPLALIFSLVSLVLFVLLRLSLSRRLRELRWAAASSQELTAAQRQQVETLVAQRVAEALRAASPGAERIGEA